MTRSRKRWATALVIIACIALAAVNAPRLHLLGWAERTEYAASTQPRDTAAVLLSGDMGLQMGLSKDLVQGLAKHGFAVTGVSAPVAFAQRLTRAQTDTIVENAIKDALARGAHKVVLVGQSFGADILATVVPDLPERLRPKVAGVVLVVPSNNVHFRADPSGIAYLGTPDARPAAALARMSWTPFTCIHGTDEAASLCPMLGSKVGHIIALPGDHYLHHDAPRVVAAVLSALAGVR